MDNMDNKKKKNKLDWIGIVFLVIVLAVIGCCVFAFIHSRGSLTAERSIVVETCSGDVTVEGKHNKGEAFEGELLENGDKVDILEESSMIMNVDSDKHVYADENTAFHLETKNGLFASGIRICLDKGTVRNVLDNKLENGEFYEVDTSSLTMSVRGTTFTVSVDEDEDETAQTKVDVEEGEVLCRIKDDDGKYTGEEVVLEKNEHIISGNYTRNGWLDDHGIKIMPQGSTEFYAASSIGFFGHGYDTTVPGTVAITESTEGCDPGTKNVIVDCTIDFTGVPEWGISVECMDRYTGTLIGNIFSKGTVSEGEDVFVSSDEMGTFSIVNGTYAYTLSEDWHRTYKDAICTIRCTVYCPEDYDGVALVVGYWDPASSEELIDGKQYTMDQIIAFDPENPKLTCYTYTND